ncbi:YdcF family protein [Paenibacillus koleovorans]|uniref:YdcF family protein n=1 Tax=Paenibacillus koleovorans TaxID=121608 RepID=UPI000FD77CB4|nr:YdcF family protein [Paenibacillus koleovorans]
MSNGPVSFSRRRRRWTKTWLFRAAVALIALGLLWTAFIQWKIYTPPETDASARADVGIVLGASLWNNEPSPGLRERLDRALTLYKDGQVKHLIVSGGLDYNGSTLTEAEGMKNYLVRQGVPEEAVVLEPQARSTYDNVRYSKRLMAERGWTKAILITHEYHAARSYDIARFLDMEDPRVSSMTSSVMWMPWHKVRETLAYTKWELDKLRLIVFGSDE